jgi:2-C-methyl-D-erythritol 4-phosphate cytidylyltransferase
MRNDKLTTPQCHALLPTAGSGSRLGGKIPKQFQDLAGQPMLAYALEAFSQTPEIVSIWVGVSQGFIEHPLLTQLAMNHPIVHCVASGGLTRQETVRNTLAAMLASGISGADWVLVHDAARPGITTELIQKLIITVSQEGEGGLLAIPVADTLKLTSGTTALAENPIRAEKTISRIGIWQAQTPQMFKLQALHDAIDDAIRMDQDITDEASAMELQGHHPLLIEGSARNFKVTQVADWELMQSVLNLNPIK